MVNLLIEIIDLFDRYDEWKEKRAKDNPHCPDCGFLVACDTCSSRYSKIDEELRIKEGRPLYDFSRSY